MLPLQQIFRCRKHNRMRKKMELPFSYRSGKLQGSSIFLFQLYFCYSASTRIMLVFPGTSSGTPALITTLSPALSSPWFFADSRQQ